MYYSCQVLWTVVLKFYFYFGGKLVGFRGEDPPYSPFSSPQDKILATSSNTLHTPIHSSLEGSITNHAQIYFSQHSSQHYQTV